MTTIRLAKTNYRLFNKTRIDRRKTNVQARIFIMVQVLFKMHNAIDLSCDAVRVFCVAAED